MPLRLPFTIRTKPVPRAHRRPPVVTRAVAVLVSLALCAAIGGLTAGPAAAASRAAARAAADCTDVRLVLVNGSGARPITKRRSACR